MPLDEPPWPLVAGLSSEGIRACLDPQRSGEGSACDVGESSVGSGRLHTLSPQLPNFEHERVVAACSPCYSRPSLHTRPVFLRPWTVHLAPSLSSMTQAEVLQQFKQRHRSSPQFLDQLTSLLSKNEYKECIPNLQDHEVVWLVNYPDKVCLYSASTLHCSFLSIHRLSNPSKPCLPVRPSGNACVSSEGSAARQQLPQSYILQSPPSIHSRCPVASGGSGDTCECSLDGPGVCAKRPRIYARGGFPGVKKACYSLFSPHDQSNRYSIARL